MTDYTPTTEDIRAGFHEWTLPREERSGVISASEFDRWLATHDKEVAEQERAAVAVGEHHRDPE